MRWFRKKVVRGFCKVMNFSFLNATGEMSSDEKKEMTRDEYDSAIIFAFNMRDGWLGSDNVIVYEKTGETIPIDGKSFKEVVYEGMLIEGIVMRGFDENLIADQQEAIDIINELINV